MTDAKFKQLVNSFLDREISQKDHLLLAKEIADNPARRDEFNRYRKLHAAERQALAKLFARDAGASFGALGALGASGSRGTAGGKGSVAGSGATGAAGHGGVAGDGSAHHSAAGHGDHVDSAAHAAYGGAAGQESPEAAARRAVAEQLKARAARAWSEVQLLAVERRKRRVLITQFTVAAVVILSASFFLCRHSLQAIAGSNRFQKESEAISADSARLERLRERLRSRQGVAIEWVNNERGEPVALVGRDVEGSVFVLTSPEMPRLNHSQLAVLMNQLNADERPAAVRSRFIVTGQFTRNVLPDVDPLLPPPVAVQMMTSSRRAEGFEAFPSTVGGHRYAAENVRLPAVDSPANPARGAE